MNDYSSYTGSPFSDSDSWWILMVGRLPAGGGWAQLDSCGGVPPLKTQQQVWWKLLLQNLATLSLLALAGVDPPTGPPGKTFHSLLALEDGVLDRAMEEEGLSRQCAPLLSSPRVRGWVWPWVWLWPALRWWCCGLGVFLRQWAPSRLWKAFLNSWLEHG